MKSFLYLSGMLAILLCFSSQKSRAQANTSLYNLAATAVNVDLLPGTDNLLSLGTAAKGWKQLYISNAVFLGGSKFISYGNTLGLGITAVGNNALAVNSGGFANTGIGFYSLAANTNGNANAAIGTRSLQANTTGSGNMAMGYFSLYSNKTGFSNVAIGVRAMLSSTTGNNQVAIGDSALFSMTGGGFNTAIGSKALYSNNSSFNTGLGYQSLYSNSTGAYNTATGVYSLWSNTGGFNNTAGGYQSMFSNATGNWNTGFGVSSLYHNTDGSANTAVGYGALYMNTTSEYNTAVGFNALFVNGTGTDNTAVGESTLSNNTTGSYNTASGSEALGGNSTGSYNTASGFQALVSNSTGATCTTSGYQSLFSNTSGSANTGIGLYALYANTIGGSNTGIGVEGLQSNVSGTGNTALGYAADVNAGNLSNATAIGYGATATASNQIMLGNTSINAIYAAGSFVLYSDGRFKKDIKADVPGLEFIRELRAVTYHYNIHGMNDHIGKLKPASGQIGKGSETTDQSAPPDPTEETVINAKEKKLYTGFVAQEVEKAAAKFNYDFSGLYKPQNEKDLYGLSYSDFVVPLVKAVQELNDSNEAKNDKINFLQDEVDSLKIGLQELRDLIKGSSSSFIPLYDASLSQNTPNPFTGSTNINYTLPQNAGRARLTVSDISGRIIKTVMINGAGRGNLNIDASGLSSGVYNYTLYVDEIMVSTRQMVLTK